MKIKLKVAMNGFSKGRELTIATDNGVPVDQYWRRRLKDAEIDKSIEIVQTKETVKTKEKSKPTKRNS